MDGPRILLVAESALLAGLLEAGVRAQAAGLDLRILVGDWQELCSVRMPEALEGVEVVLYITAARVPYPRWASPASRKRPPMVLVDCEGTIGLYQAIEFGAEGYVGSGETARDVVNRVLQAAQGHLAISTDKIAGVRATLQRLALHGLRERGLLATEEQLLRWVADGIPVKAIATYLRRSESAAYGRLRRLRMKLGVETLQEMAIVAAQAGLISEGQNRRAKEKDAKTSK